MEAGDRLLYGAAVGVDLALRTALASTITLPMAATALTARGGEEHLHFYADLAARRDPEAVFHPPEPVDVRVTHGRDLGLPGGAVDVLRFDSPYVALNPDLRDAYARHAPNGVARAQHWRHDDGPRQTLCVIHGFGASPASFNAAFFSLRTFFSEGWDVLMFTLPFHGSRRTHTRSAPNGLDLFSGGFPQLCEAIVHGVHDLRAFIGYLLDRGAPRVGATGLSLGGYTTAVLAAAEPRLAFAIPNAPVVSIPPLADSWFPINVVRALLEPLTRIDRELAAAALAIHSPLNYAPVLAKDKLMIVAGRGDRLAPPEQAEWLWEHWERPELHWFPGSHILHFGRRDYFDAMRRVMRAA